MTSIWTPERQARALAEAEFWRGTRHRNRIASVGVGIDCIRFVVRVLVAAGVVDDATIPTYQTAEGLASQRSKLAEAFARALDVERIPVAEWEPQFGDLCLWAVGGNSNHVAICLGASAWHVSSLTPCGPIAIDHARRRMQEAQRIKRTGWTVDPASIRPGQL